MSFGHEPPDPLLEAQRVGLSLQRTGLRDYRAAVVAQLAQYWLGPNFLMVPPSLQAIQIEQAVAQADALLSAAERVGG